LDNKLRNFMMRPSKLAAGASCAAGSVASLFLSLWIFFQKKERVERGEEELGWVARGEETRGQESGHREESWQEESRVERALHLSARIRP
jgi:hypothetical protein